ncbi:MAG: peptidase MA family metallohydrolase, partial [Anaerolineae bacterium]
MMGEKRKTKNGRRNAWLFRFSFFVLLWFGSGPQLLLAQETAAAVSYSFGQSLLFSLESERTDVETAVLFFAAPQFPNALQVSLPVAEGQPIDLSYRVNLAEIRLAPFSTVTYWWELLTTAGDWEQLPRQTFTYADDRFSWQERPGQIVTVFWTGDDPALGQLAQDIVAESLPRLQAILPVTPMPFSLYLYPSSADLRSALRLTGRDWVGAHADPGLGVMLVTAVNPRTAAADLRQSIPHEMVHLLLYQTMGAQVEALPAWLNEGVATLLETNPNPGYELALETAVANQTLIPFKDLCLNFPSAEEQAILAYAQSASFLRYIQTQHGNRAIGDMVAAYADGADCQTGVERGISHSLSDLDSAWQQSLSPTTSLAFLWQDYGVWLIVMIGGFGLSLLLML